MKYSPLKCSITVGTLGALAFMLGPAVFRAHADQWNKKTIITVDQPIQVTDTYLEAGTYVFKLADSSSDRHIVYIFNKDENHLINTVMAIPNYRLEPTGNSRFLFWETPPGSARALRAWFYPGDNFGQEFTYPKHLRTIEVASLAPPPVVERAPEPQPPPPPPPQAVPEPVPAPEPVVTEPQAKVEEQEIVIAQNTPPPPPPPQAEAPPPAAAPAEPPQELPKTATPFPAIGLGGLLSLVTYGLLKLKGSA